MSGNLSPKARGLDFCSSEMFADGIRQKEGICYD